MKRILAILLALLMCIALLAGCGGDTEPKESAQPSGGGTGAPTNAATGDTAEPSVTGETFDAGNVRALVPEGWKAFPQTDVFAEEAGATDPDVISICKGAETDFDLMVKPFIRIDYYGPDTQFMGALKDWYSDTADLEPIQAGGYTWEGFTTTDYGLMAIIWTVDGDHEYQASVYLETDGGKISLDDADVLAILASVEPSDGSGSGGSSAADSTGDESSEDIYGDESGDDFDGETVSAANYDWWNNGWYGWWCIKNGTGSYESASDVAWDAYAEIEVYGDNTGSVTLWDAGTTKDAPLAYGFDLSFEDGASELGQMTSSRVVFFPNGVWNYGTDAYTMDDTDIGWTVDPAESSVSHFEDMLEITGHYEAPEFSEDSFDYYIYLRPWGTLWEDVYYGDTSGCIYSDMMPINYYNWYVTLLDLGYVEPLYSQDDGIDIINAYLAELEGNS